MHENAAHDTEGYLVHWGRTYDLFVGPLVRKTDRPILTLAEVKSGDAVLDVGTGPGFLARTASRIVGPSGRAVGLDASPEMIAQAEKVAARKQLAATFVLAGAQQMPFGDAEFDAVVSRLAMHHIPTMREAAISEILRVLKVGGRVVIADLATDSLRGAIHDAVRRAHGGEGVVHSDLEALLKQAGFAGVESGHIGMLSYAKARKPAEIAG